jgi:hypothetical protein
MACSLNGVEHRHLQARKKRHRHSMHATGQDGTVVLATGFGLPEAPLFDPGTGDLLVANAAAANAPPCSAR